MPIPAIALIGAAAVSAIGSMISSGIQTKAAGSAADKARRAGEEAKDYMEGQYDKATPLVEQGYTEGQDYLSQAGSVFDQERQLGIGANDRLKNILLGGDMSQAQLDPGYEFRLREGNKAIERAAIASGGFGSGANLKELTRYGQDYASQEFNNVLNRLSILSNMGSAANVNYANVLGQRGALSVDRGQSLANLLTSRGTAGANLLTGQAATESQFRIAAANAAAQGVTGVSNAIRGGISDYAFGQGMKTQIANQAGSQGYMQPIYAPPAQQGSGAYGLYPGFLPQMSMLSGGK